MSERYPSISFKIRRRQERILVMSDIDKKLKSEEEAIGWFNNLSEKDKSFVLSKLKNELIASLKRTPDRLMMELDKETGEIVKFLGYEDNSKKE